MELVERKGLKIINSAESVCCQTDADICVSKCVCVCVVLSSSSRASLAKTALSTVHHLKSTLTFSVPFWCKDQTE